MLRISNVSEEALRKMSIHDLARLACDAAAELDQYRLGRGSGSESALFTAQWLMDRVDDYGNPHPDSAAVALLHHVMVDAEALSRPVAQVGELLIEVEKVAGRLYLVAQFPERFGKYNPGELNLMRDFCLQLSSCSGARRM